MLTITDEKILFGLYDWLQMPADLIEYLIKYCVTNNRTAMLYIEKLAIHWVDQGIRTLEQAQNHVVYEKRYYQIFMALGCSKSAVTSVEKEMMNKWLGQYHFDIEVILEACRRTVALTHRPSLKYVDAILTSWHNDKVVSLQDINEIDEKYEKAKVNKARNTSFFDLQQENAALKLEMDALNFKLRRSLERNTEIEEHYKKEIEILKMQHNAEAKLAIAELMLQIAELKEKLSSN